MDATTVQIVGYILSLVGVLLTVIVNNKASADKITNSLQMNQAVTDQKIEGINKDLADMKKDIADHNHYAKLFAENVPVLQEQLKVANNRIQDLEDELKYLEREHKDHADNN